MKQDPTLLALSFYGEQPLLGEDNVSQVTAFLRTLNKNGEEIDEVPWCSSFLVWIFKQCCIETPANASAMSWLNFSHHTDNPKVGDVVVLGWAKETATHHHVGIFIRKMNEVVYILAGDQDSTINIVAWKKEDVISYRKTPSMRG